jgi:hypothetical protein
VTLTDRAKKKKERTKLNPHYMQLYVFLEKNYLKKKT